MMYYYLIYFLSESMYEMRLSLCVFVYRALHIFVSPLFNSYMFGMFSSCFCWPIGSYFVWPYGPYTHWLHIFIKGSHTVDAVMFIIFLTLIVSFICVLLLSCAAERCTYKFILHFMYKAMIHYDILKNTTLCCGTEIFIHVPHIMSGIILFYTLSRGIQVLIIQILHLTFRIFRRGIYIVFWMHLMSLFILQESPQHYSTPNEEYGKIHVYCSIANWSISACVVFMVVLACCQKWAPKSVAKSWNWFITT